MSSNFFQGVYFGLVTVASCVCVVHTREYRKTAVAEDHRTVVDATLTALPGLGMFLLPIVYVLTPWLDFADYHLPLWAGWIGVAVFALAIWLLARSHADLARNWSPRLELLDGHFLVTDGVFCHIRHPMYAAHLLWSIAQVFLLQNWIAGFSMLVVFLPGYFYRARVEEEMMIEHFGDEYCSYMGRTGRLFPRLRRQPARHIDSWSAPGTARRRTEGGYSR
jgi:protein-S-isoprenylcysteine O-methyltransferase Ste14